jgi:hypothetical protein
VLPTWGYEVGVYFLRETILGNGDLVILTRSRLANWAESKIIPCEKAILNIKIKANAVTYKFFIHRLFSIKIILGKYIKC